MAHADSPADPRSVAPSRDRWALEDGAAHLNHGSFGAVPREVLEHQRALRAEMESQGVRFLWWDLEGRLDAVRDSLGAFVDAHPDDLALIPNATAGVNTVLRSLRLSPGDELLATDHGYNACANALEAVAEAAGARVTTAAVPYPLRGPDEALGAIVRAITPRTRLVLVDHVTSPTALVLPVAEIAAACRARGVAVLVDGAHGPGMVPLSLRGLAAAGVTYYTGNLHKWVCAPKGAAFLWVAPEEQGRVRPLVISHGANSPRSDRSRFRLEFDWTGTCDPTPWLCVPEALRVMGALLPGGWDAVRAANRALCLRARDLLCAALEVEAPAPDSMLGSMAAVPLPRRVAPGVEAGVLYRRLWTEAHIEAPVMPWPCRTARMLRVSAQQYNTLAEYSRLAEVLQALTRP